MPSYRNLDEINEVLEDRDNVLVISMEDLRNAHGDDRLGSWVRISISKDLLRKGIGHYPCDLPSYQQEYAILYKLATPAAELISSVLNPAPGADVIIRNALSDNATEILQQIRVLVEPEDD